MLERSMVWLMAAVAALAAAAMTAGAAEPPGLDTVAAWMTGSFSSAAQAAADPEFLDIRLEMVPIWPEAVGVRWLYVEQAVADRLEAPYRQRVYRLRELSPGVYECEIYTLVDPARLVGAWREESLRATLTPDDIRRRESCNVTLRWTGECLEGGTEGRHCASDLAGASYATSVVTVHDGLLASWDRGFDAAGTQTWGSEKGAYVFVREQAVR